MTSGMDYGMDKNMLQLKAAHHLSLLMWLKPVPLFQLLSLQHKGNALQGLLVVALLLVGGHGLLNR